ncbi:signal transduction histidine kinase [Kineosphaera limosa]|uniref:histidine kinase n=1 Tax=Kineosphaera limosa NBRC 100340 TaxID=1184609 RepID=K6X0F0_9MICO|nr:histidine kinase [Kineosphaera limosa]NYD98993.1 signal transduction histidine kinase [Kineosphaera limosa]GAB97802.1 putative two-component histidine kinase [Kineosphaera limosa NBRC 100340]
MRVAFVIAVIAPALLLVYPGLDADEPVRSAVLVDVVTAIVAAAVIFIAASRGPSRRSWQPLLGLVALLWVASVLILHFMDVPWLHWPGTTSWMVAVAAGMLTSSVGLVHWAVWEGHKRSLRDWLPSVPATAWWAFVFAATATLSPLTEGWRNGAVFIPGMFILTTMAIGVGLGVRGQRLRLTRQRVQVRDRERRAMARELHDVIAHEVAGIVVMAQAVQGATPDPTSRQALARIEAAGERALQGIRAIVATSREDEPTVGRAGRGNRKPHTESLDDVGRLVDDFEHTTSATVRLHRRGALDGSESGGGSVSAPIAGAAYRIVAESLGNVRRHGRDVTHVDVVLELTGRTLVIEVCDDGAATTLTSVEDADGWGLPGIAERADLVGGRVETGPRPQGGWRVRAELPLRGPGA